MQASIGRIVTLKGPLFNGSDEHPAMITRVWDGEPVPGAQYVNLTVFPDFSVPYCHSSVYMFESRAAAEEYRAVEVSRYPDNGPPIVAFWPDRVGGASVGLVGQSAAGLPTG